MVDPDTIRYLGERGISAAPEELNQYLAEAVSTLRTLVVRPPVHELTAGESDILKEGGFDLSPQPEKSDPLAHAMASFAALLETALSTKMAARVLKRAESRVRQRLLERTVIGIRRGRSWALPLFQFDVRTKSGRPVPVGLVPGVEKTFPRLDPELHPVAIYTWFTSPSDELWDEERSQALSPREWLLAGNPVDPVVSLAADL